MYHQIRTCVNTAVGRKKISHLTDCFAMWHQTTSLAEFLTDLSKQDGCFGPIVAAPAGPELPTQSQVLGWAPRASRCAALQGSCGLCANEGKVKEQVPRQVEHKADRDSRNPV